MEESESMQQHVLSSLPRLPFGYTHKLLGYFVNLQTQALWTLISTKTQIKQCK